MSVSTILCMYIIYLDMHANVKIHKHISDVHVFVWCVRIRVYVGGAGSAAGADVALADVILFENRLSDAQCFARAHVHTCTRAQEHTVHEQIRTLCMHDMSLSYIWNGCSTCAKTHSLI